MAIGAILGRADTRGRMREMRIKRLAAVTFGRKCLLLRINPFAVLILRADHDRARRAYHRHPLFLHGAVDAEHEDVVAYDLWIVGCEISVGDAFEFILRYALVRFHRQMTAETARRPRCVTDLAIHRRVVVREFDAPFFRGGWHNTAPFSAVASQRFRVSRLRIVVRRERIDRVDRLRNLPAYVRRHARLLKKFAPFPNEPRTKRCVAGVGEINLTGVTARD